MINELANLKNAVDDGQSSALLMSPRTVRLILTELQKMCVTSDDIECIPVNNDSPGFWMRLRNRGGQALVPYEMDWDAATITPFVDDWDINNQPAGKDGVKWKGPRVVSTVSATPTFTSTDSNSDTTVFQQYSMYYFTRECTYDSTGRLIAISAETIMNMNTVILIGEE